MAAPILVFGHKNPDNDAISAAVGYAYLKNELVKRDGVDATYEAVCLGSLPPETDWILGERGIETPRLIESVEAGQQVILVDHNEALQSADGLDAAEILEIVDHHRLGGLVTAQPLRFNARPVGSTAAIVAREFEIEGVERRSPSPRCCSAPMLTDTVIMKSPTTTDFDRDIIARTAEAVGVDRWSTACPSSSAAPTRRAARRQAGERRCQGVRAFQRQQGLHRPVRNGRPQGRA